MQKQISRHHPSPAKMDLRIDLKNFGPIASGSVRMRPLTIFIGPNGSGKSYAAMLVHSILSGNWPQRYGKSRFQRSNAVTNAPAVLEKIIRSSKETDRMDIPTDITKKIVDSLIYQYGGNIDTALCRNFGVSGSGELVRAGCRLARILVSGQFEFSMSLGKKFGFKIAKKPNPRYAIEKVYKKTGSYPISIDERDGVSMVMVEDDPYVRFEIADEILDHMYKKIIPYDRLRKSHYLPASRSGILQGHKALSAGIIENASFGGIDSFEIPRLAGTTADFISGIIRARDRPGHYSDLARSMESELLEGRIKLPPTGDSFSEITYESKDIAVPMHRASSTITEIAPLSLYLKHVVRPGSLLIIEEPEAHLHPANQIIMAKYIVKMIQSGINVLVTTHSGSLVERLGHFVLIGRIPPEKRTVGRIKDADWHLDDDDVGVHLFQKKSHNNHIIKPLQIDKDVGIPQEEFMDSTEWLSEDFAKIHHGIEGDLDISKATQ